MKTAQVAAYILDLLTGDTQQEHVDRGSMQTAEPLLNRNHPCLSSQDKGGQHSHQWLDGHAVFSKNSPDTLWFNIGKQSTVFNAAA